jgi:Protein of unknown function (DUF1207)
MRRLLLSGGLIFGVALPHAPALAVEDAYLDGYVAATLEQRFGIRDPGLVVRDGVLRLDPGALPAERRAEIITALSRIEGLEVEVLGPARIVPLPTPVSPEVAAEPERPESAPPPGEEVVLVPGSQGWLPRETLFDPLIADPRWPQFSASIQFYSGDTELDTVASTNFGATIPVYGWEGLGWQWQLGAQGGVFSIFDLDSDSFDLINADYLAGIPLQMRRGDFSTQLRFFHQSSHLGDEFLLRNRVERINLSYEAIDALLSYELFDAFRVYGGGGGIVHSDPDLDPLFAHAGIEATSPEPIIGNSLFPVAAFDFQASEELDWDQNYSVRAGLELRTEVLEERRLQLMFEYFNGRSPNGQFFERELEYFGTGLHFYF